MKKTLCVFLTALMFLGAFAVGASASASTGSFEEFAYVNASAPLGIAEFSAPVFAQDAADEQYAKDILAIMAAVMGNATQRAIAAPAFVLIDILGTNPKAYNSGKTKAALDIARGALDSEHYFSAYYAFCADEAKVNAAYDNGTLKDKLLELTNAAIDQYIAAHDPLLAEYFTPKARTYANEFSKILNLALIFANADLTVELRAEITAKLDAVTAGIEKSLEDALNAGDFDKATKIVKDAAKKIEKILADYGLIDGASNEPSFFTKVWNFILKWIFFGWIWMPKG